MCKIQHPKQPCNFSPWWTLRFRVWGWYFGEFSQNKAEGALADLDFQFVLIRLQRTDLSTGTGRKGGGLISSTGGNCFQNREFKATPKASPVLGAQGPADCFQLSSVGTEFVEILGMRNPKPSIRSVRANLACS